MTVEKFEQMFHLANGKPKPDGVEESFFGVFIQPLADRYLKVDEAGEVYAVDKLGIKRFSPKDPSRAMNALEYFDELKKGNLKFCFTDPVKQQPKPRMPQVVDVSNLSRAERITYWRAEKAKQNKQ